MQRSVEHRPSMIECLFDWVTVFILGSEVMSSSEQNCVKAETKSVKDLATHPCAGWGGETTHNSLEHAELKPAVKSEFNRFFHVVQ